MLNNEKIVCSSSQVISQNFDLFMKSPQAGSKKILEWIEKQLTTDCLDVTLRVHVYPDNRAAVAMLHTFVSEDLQDSNRLSKLKMSRIARIIIIHEENEIEVYPCKSN